MSPPQTRGPGGRPIKMATATATAAAGAAALSASERGAATGMGVRVRTAGSVPTSSLRTLTIARAVSACLDVRLLSLSVMALKVAAVVGGAAKAALRPALLCRPWEVRRGSGPWGQPQRLLGRSGDRWLAERLGARLAVGPVRGGEMATRWS